jgi:hypothetical protein
VIDKETPAEELAARISGAMEEAGIQAVLSGGAAVQIYTENAYLTPDLDFVSSASHKALDPVMNKLGFVRVAGMPRYYKHPASDYYVEFPPGPVAVGGKVLRQWGRVETPAGSIVILTPTQCVMDRLSAYYAWNDPQSLRLAVLVATKHDVDLDEIRTWSEQEDASDKLEIFLRRLRNA